jgi:branched-chain amino acid aminotransferase
MSNLRLYAVTSTGPQALAVPATAGNFLDLYHGLALGAYTVLRTFEHNKFLNLAEHLNRLIQSLQLMGIEERLDVAGLRQALHTVCTDYPFVDMRVRIDVLPAPALAMGTESRVLVALMPFSPLPPDDYERGVVVGFAAGLQRHNPLAKVANFAVARQKVLDEGNPVFERLLVDPDGRILEGTSSNFYGIREGVLYTAGAGVLPGVTRQTMLALADALGIPIKLEAVRIDEVVHLSEAALSSSTRGLVPVIRIGGQTIGDGRPGPICRRLMTAYETHVAHTIKSAIEQYQADP